MKIIYIFLFSQIIYLQMKAQESFNEDMQKLKDLNAKFIHNFVTNDTASHNEILHPDFVCLRSDGKYVDRKNYLLEWAHGYDGYKYWDYRDEKISIFGSTALVRSQNKYTLVKDGKEVSGMATYTDVYVKENDKWLVIQAQIGTVSPENYADDQTIVRKYE